MSSSRFLLLALSLCLVAAFGLSPSPARAESGDLNLRVGVGAGAPIAGVTQSSGGEDAGGGLALIGLDWQRWRPWALDLSFGIGGFSMPIPGSAVSGTRFSMLSAGVLWRPLDDDRGYATEDGGSIWGDLWASAHIGVYGYDGTQFGMDFTVGYELSVTQPMSIGLFLMSAVMVGGTTDGADAIMVGGLNFTFAVAGSHRAPDADDDGLSDEEEAELGTDPNDPDTDGDRIPDGLEHSTGTNPAERDSDGDTLADNREDRNRNGEVDEGETDPRDHDTDHGGIWDGEERHTPGFDPTDPVDDDRDHDGVPDNHDRCLDTAPDASVTVDGCDAGPDAPAMGERMELDGIKFESGSDHLLDESTQALQAAVRMLQAHEEIRIEIGGHTDSLGNERTNRRLSRSRARAVMDWLVMNGISRDRLSIRGYGSARPAQSNDTAEGRAHNRRIEFRRISE